MPSRRQALQGMGVLIAGGIAGCSSSETITGNVAHKKISVGVPDSEGTSVDVTLASLTYELEQQLISGEYADTFPEVVPSATLSVINDVHDRLEDRFRYVHYFANVVPTDGGEPANGLLARGEFNSLPIGGTATVNQYMKEVDAGSSVGHLKVTESKKRDQSPNNVDISQYQWEKRVEDI